MKKCKLCNEIKIVSSKSVCRECARKSRIKDTRSYQKRNRDRILLTQKIYYYNKKITSMKDLNYPTTDNFKTSIKFKRINEKIKNLEEQRKNLIIKPNMDKQ